MVQVTIDVDETTLFYKPQQAIQSFSVQLIRERQRLFERMHGLDLHTAKARGTVVCVTQNNVTIECSDRTKQTLTITGPILRQLMAGVTTR